MLALFNNRRIITKMRSTPLSRYQRNVPDSRIVRFESCAVLPTSIFPGLPTPVKIFLTIYLFVTQKFQLLYAILYYFIPASYTKGKKLNVVKH